MLEPLWKRLVPLPDREHRGEVLPTLTRPATEMAARMCACFMRLNKPEAFLSSERLYGMVKCVNGKKRDMNERSVIHHLSAEREALLRLACRGVDDRAALRAKAVIALAEVAHRR